MSAGRDGFAEESLASAMMARLNWIAARPLQQGRGSSIVDCMIPTDGRCFASGPAGGWRRACNGVMAVICSWVVQLGSAEPTEPADAIEIPETIPKALAEGFTAVLAQHQRELQIPPENPLWNNLPEYDRAAMGLDADPCEPERQSR